MSNTVTPLRPSATIEVWSRHLPEGPGPLTTLGWGDFDILASDGHFSDPRWIGSHPFGSRLGIVDGNRVYGVLWQQAGFPKAPLPENPVRIWAATWTTEEFTPRRVSVETLGTTGFVLFYEPYWFYYRILPDRPERFFPGRAEIQVTVDGCYADCDSSTGRGVLDIFDFLCFQDRFFANAPYACGCDTTTGVGLCDVFDFLCFQNEFVRGCP